MHNIKFLFFYSLSMYLELTPLQLQLSGRVTLEITLPWGAKLKFTLFSAVIWRYRTPMIRKKIIDNRSGEKDYTPPEVSSFTNSANEIVCIIFYIRIQRMGNFHRFCLYELTCYELLLSLNVHCWSVSFAFHILIFFSKTAGPN